MKLFYVECKGMRVNVTGAPHGIAYVLENDATEAYLKLKSRLDRAGIGSGHERILDSVKLVAEEGEFPDCRMQLIS